MRNLFYLIERFHLLFLLLILEGFALMFVRKTNLYQDSVLGNASNAVSGKIYTVRTDISEYFGLKQENERLAEENAHYLSQVSYPIIYPKDTTLPAESDSIVFNYLVAKVIDNNITQSVNYIMINKGINDGIEKGQGLITGLGVVGIITNISADYAMAMSVVSTKSRISLKHKKSGAFGNLTWDGTNPWRLSIDNVSKTNTVAVGDTFVTAGYSNFFPPNIPAAIVSEVRQDPSTSFLYIDVKLSIDIDKLDYVYIVKSKDKPQIDSLRYSLPIITE
jgi:rod shape-determining protein MreC